MTSGQKKIILTSFDLTGICDSREDNETFDKLMHDNIDNVELLFGISDIKTAFLTTYEVNEFNKLKEFLKNKNSSICKCSDNLWKTVDSSDSFNLLQGTTIRLYPHEAHHAEPPKKVGGGWKMMLTLPKDGFQVPP